MDTTTTTTTGNTGQNPVSGTNNTTYTEGGTSWNTAFGTWTVNTGKTEAMNEVSSACQKFINTLHSNATPEGCGYVSTAIEKLQDAHAYAQKSLSTPTTTNTGN